MNVIQFPTSTAPADAVCCDALRSSMTVFEVKPQNRNKKGDSPCIELANLTN